MQTGLGRFVLPAEKETARKKKMPARKTTSKANSKGGDGDDAAPDFEKAMAELEDVVRRLETGDQPLEESLAAFEKGVGLVKALHVRLDAVQTRIDELTQGADGQVLLVPLDADEDDEL